MQRREFVKLIGSAAVTWPLSARAQHPNRVRRIGVLLASDENDPDWQLRTAIFVKDLENLGWKVGENLVIDFRSAGNNSERIRLYATELVGLKPDVIWTSGGLTLLSLKRTTRTIPIVFTTVYDPVGSGYVASLAQPGGNITGFTLGEFSMGGKMLEVLKEVAPQVGRVAVILNLEQPGQVAMWSAIEPMAKASGVRLIATDVQNAADIESAIEAFAREPNGGLIVLPSPITIGHRELIIALAARHRLPAAYGFRIFVTGGGLVSYGADPYNQSRQSAVYVDRILKGAKAGELPIQQPTKFDLVINVRTAKTLGLALTSELLTRADEVIE
jgi:putative ABC transport system substrate-binding protein